MCVVERGQHNDHGNGFLEGYAEELDRAAMLGATGFSYAIDWARLEPQPGVFDDAEISRIEAIVNAIRARHMRPMIVLFDWVMPTWVQSPPTGVDTLAATDQGFVDAFLPGVFRNVTPFFVTPHFDVREYDPSLPHSDAYLEISGTGLRSVIEEYSRYGVQGLFQVDVTQPTFPRTRTGSADLFSTIAHMRRIDPTLWNSVWMKPTYPVAFRRHSFNTRGTKNCIGAHCRLHGAHTCPGRVRLRHVRSSQGWTRGSREALSLFRARAQRWTMRTVRSGESG